MDFRAWLVFVLLWSLAVHRPLAHCSGRLAATGRARCPRFAGGLVVELASGLAALVAFLRVGPRRSHPQAVAPQLASLACLTMNTAGLAAALTWMLVGTAQRGNLTAAATTQPGRPGMPDVGAGPVGQPPDPA